MASKHGGWRPDAGRNPLFSKRNRILLGAWLDALIYRERVAAAVLAHDKDVEKASRGKDANLRALQQDLQELQAAALASNRLADLVGYFSTADGEVDAELIQEAIAGLKAAGVLERGDTLPLKRLANGRKALAQQVADEFGHGVTAEYVEECRKQYLEGLPLEVEQATAGDDEAFLLRAGQNARLPGEVGEED